MDNFEEKEFENQEAVNEEREAVPNNEEAAQQQAEEVMDTAMNIIGTAADMAAAPKEKPKAEGGNEGGYGDPSVADSFAGLPMEALISKPFVAAALSQQELNAIYVDTVLKLAYKDGTGNDGTPNTLNMTLKRPVIKADGSMDTQDTSISAPLLALVPIPALSIDTVTVDFNMEVKTSEMSSSETKADVSTKVSYKSWFGLNAEITGNVSSDSQHKRQSDSSATYTVHARASQLPPAEGMAKLTSLLSNVMEPIDTRTKS